MKISLFAVVTVFAPLAGVGLASAQTSTSTSTTWTTDGGTATRVYSTSKHYSLFSGPSLKPNVGMELPGTVRPNPLPGTIKAPSADRYSLVDDRPVVVEPTTRTVIHIWK